MGGEQGSRCIVSIAAVLQMWGLGAVRRRSWVQKWRAMICKCCEEKQGGSMELQVEKLGLGVGRARWRGAVLRN